MAGMHCEVFANFGKETSELIPHWEVDYESAAYKKP